MKLLDQFKFTPLLFVLLGLNACSGGNTKYRDTSELEQPPNLEIVVNQSESSKTEGDETKARKGLGNAVQLLDDSELTLKYSLNSTLSVFDIVLKISDMEVVDRNRDKGQFYVVFDPDNAERKDASQGFFSSLIKEDRYPPARYLITLKEKSPGTRITAEFLEYPNAQAEQEYNNIPDKGVAKLLQKLYWTLRDDLSLD